MNTTNIYQSIIKGGDKEHGLQVQKEKEVLAEREMLETAKWKQFSSSEIGRELLFSIKARIEELDWKLDMACLKEELNERSALNCAIVKKTLRDVIFRINTGKFEN